MPPAARMLGFELIEADPDHGSIVVGFAGNEEFTNPHGEVLGGFLAAMLYDTVGPALLAVLPAGQFIETLELHTTFLRAGGVGRFVGRGRVLARRGDVAQLDGVLHDSSGRLVARATAAALIVPASPDGVAGVTP